MTSNPAPHWSCPSSSGRRVAFSFLGPHLLFLTPVLQCRVAHTCWRRAGLVWPTEKQLSGQLTPPFDRIGELCRYECSTVASFLPFTILAPDQAPFPERHFASDFQLIRAKIQRLPRIHRHTLHKPSAHRRSVSRPSVDYSGASMEWAF